MTGQDLRNSILQLAIQGKLVEQRKEEGTARELIEEIKKEKERLIKEKKTRKEKPLPEISEDEIPFDIPESWEWARLEDIIYTIGSKKNQIKQKEILEHGIFPVISQSKNIIEGYYSDDTKLLEIPNTVIVFGDHSRTLKIIDFNFIIGADGTKIFVPLIIEPDFLFYALEYNIINIPDGGYSRHYKYLKDKLIPLPPLEEQKRIVEKIEELMPYVDKYGETHIKLEDLNKNFPTDMQKSILQYAIQGKLVEQREEEGYAEELYNEIQKEKQKLIKEGKTKRTKALAEITEGEIPFDIPKTWKWVRLGDIFNVNMGQSPKGSSVSENKDGIEFHQGKVFFGDDYIQKSNQYTNSPTKIAEPGTVLLCVRAPVGIVNITERKICIGRGLCGINTFSGMDPKFVMYILRGFENTFIKKATGTTFIAITSKVVNDQPFPLPPLEEQKRIVEKIEELLPLCKQLQK